MERDPQLSSRQKELYGHHHPQRRAFAGPDQRCAGDVQDRGRAGDLNETTFDLRRLLQSVEEMFQLRAGQAAPAAVRSGRGCAALRARRRGQAAPGADQFAWQRDQVHTYRRSHAAGGLACGETGRPGDGNAPSPALPCGRSIERPHPSPLHPFTPSPASLLVEIEDTGEGIAEDQLSSLFEPFRQTASGVKAQEGTGLGLSISRQFVRLMGGDIRVRSACRPGHAVCLRHPARAGRPVTRLR